MSVRLLWRSLATNTAIMVPVGLSAHHLHIRHGRISDAVALTVFLLNLVVGYVVGPANGHAVRSFVLTVMAVAWNLRLLWYLVKRLNLLSSPSSLFDRHGSDAASGSHGKKHHKATSSKSDERVDSVVGESYWRAAGWWFGQSLWVTAVSSACQAANLSHLEDKHGFWTAWDRCGVMVWLVGWLVESIADDQRFQFNKTPTGQRPSPFLCDGLWSWSRHPNYCGEFMTWLGVWMVAMPVLTRPTAITTFTLSPLMTVVLLTKVSGIPISEARDDKRFGRLSAYLQYKYVTSPIFLMPPRVYARLESGVRKYVLFESFQPKVRRVKRTLLSNSLASSPNK